MTLEEALKKVQYKKRAYFRFKFGLRYFESNKTIDTEEEFLKHIKRKSIQPFIRWENSEQYIKLVAIYLQGRTANDLLEIYNSITEKAKKGDSKAVDSFLKLQNQIKQIAKGSISNDVDEGDDLEL